MELLEQAKKLSTRRSRTKVIAPSKHHLLRVFKTTPTIQDLIDAVSASVISLGTYATAYGTAQDALTAAITAYNMAVDAFAMDPTDAGLAQAVIDSSAALDSAEDARDSALADVTTAKAQLASDKSALDTAINNLLSR